MRIHISADMEGTTGVSHPQDVIPGRPEYSRFRRLLTSDVNAAIEGAAGAGAEEFLVNEAHNGMRNLIIEELDPRAELIIGNSKPLAMMEGIDGCDLTMFVGYHGRAGVDSVLSHTFRAQGVVDVELEGRHCSEARMNAALAGVYRVPVGLVTRDNFTCEEARSLYTGVCTAQVKSAIDRYSAQCLAPTHSRQRIKEAAGSAVLKRGRLTPYTCASPHTFTVEFAIASLAASVMHFPELERIDERRVSWTHEDYKTAYRMFLGVMKLAAWDPDFG